MRKYDDSLGHLSRGQHARKPLGKWVVMICSDSRKFFLVLLRFHSAAFGYPELANDHSSSSDTVVSDFDTRLACGETLESVRLTHRHIFAIALTTVSLRLLLLWEHIVAPPPCGVYGVISRGILCRFPPASIQKRGHTTTHLVI